MGQTKSTTVGEELATEAARRDAENPLGFCRERFLLPDGLVYLDGNSLGALPAAVPGAVEDVVRRQWGQGLISSWWGTGGAANETGGADGWWQAPQRVGDRIGALIGAAPGQVVAGDSTSVQLFNTLAAAARLRPGRTLLLTDPDHFPTDGYMADSVARLLGLEVNRVPPGKLTAALAGQGDRVAVVSYPAVDYRTGERWNLAEFTRAAHDAGAVTVWDLCHAAGAMPIGLDAMAADFAVGCTYKYLSGGPGSPAYVYVAERHHEAVDQPLTGWHGHREPFAMDGAFAPAAGIARARVGCPPLLSLLAMEAALTAFDGVDLERLRRASLSLTDFFLDCCDALLDPARFEPITPREPQRRGSQVALRHADAVRLVAALAEAGIVCDKREPDVLRFGFNALYNTHTEALAAVTAVRTLTAGA